MRGITGGKGIKKRLLIGFFVLAYVLSFSGCGEAIKAESDFVEVSERAESIAEETMVWIPRRGEKYHSRADCSNMEKPVEISLKQAEASGFARCKRCW